MGFGPRTSNPCTRVSMPPCGQEETQFVLEKGNLRLYVELQASSATFYSIGLTCWHLLTLIWMMGQKRVIFSSKTTWLAEGATFTCSTHTKKKRKYHLKVQCAVITSVKWMRRVFSQCWVQYWCLWDHLLREPQYELACNSSPHWLQAQSTACEWRKGFSSVAVTEIHFSIKGQFLPSSTDI